MSALLLLMAVFVTVVRPFQGDPECGDGTASGRRAKATPAGAPTLVAAVMAAPAITAA